MHFNLHRWVLGILNYLINQKNPPEFLMEVTDKTRSDVKVRVTVPLICIHFNIFTQMNLLNN